MPRTPSPLPTPSLLRRLVVCLFLALCAPACGGVTLKHVHSSVQPPSNVAVYVAVDHDGEPVTGLLPSNFSVEENGVQLDPSETRLSLLDPSIVAYHHTLVLVDLSGKWEDEERQALARGVSHLVEKLQPTQGVTVLGFDGTRRLHPLGEFPRHPQARSPELRSILHFRSRDESCNLNGAVIEGLRRLDARLRQSPKPVRVGTLVVFTRGNDLAGHVSDQQLDEALEATSHELYALGIEGRESQQLERIGRSGVQRSPNGSSLAVAFEDLALHLKKAAGKYYLVQYCSPARSGIRQVRFSVEYEDAKGSDASGHLDLEFDSDAFRGGCDPKARPWFATRLAEPGTLEAKHSREDSKGKRPSSSSDDTPPPTSEGSDGAAPIVAPPASGNYAD